jgi:hypothetical protein
MPDKHEGQNFKSCKHFQWTWCPRIPGNWKCQGSNRHESCPKYLAKTTFWKHGLSKHTIESKKEEHSKIESTNEGRGKKRGSCIMMQPGPSSQQILSQPGRTIMSAPKLSSIQAQKLCHAPITKNPERNGMQYCPTVTITKNSDAAQVYPCKVAMWNEGQGISLVTGTASATTGGVAGGASGEAADAGQGKSWGSEAPYSQERVADQINIVLSSQVERLLPRHDFLNTVVCGNEVVAVCIPTHSVML